MNLGYPAESPEAGGQRPRPPFEELYFEGRYGEPFARDPLVVKDLEESNMFQAPAPASGPEAGDSRPGEETRAAGVSQGAARALESYAAVSKWREGLANQWGGDPLAEEPEKLVHLGEFLAFLGKDPDEAIAFCFLRKRDSGERFASAKRRDEIAQQIAAWRDQSGVSGLAARRRTAGRLVLLHPRWRADRSGDDLIPAGVPGNPKLLFRRLI